MTQPDPAAVEEQVVEILSELEDLDLAPLDEQYLRLDAAQRQLSGILSDAGETGGRQAAG